MNAEVTQGNDQQTPPKHFVHGRSRSLNGGLDPSEMGRRSGAARRARRAERDQRADEARLTARQRLGIALSELTIEDMRGVIAALVTAAKTGDEKAVHALARLLDQSFGRAQEQVDEVQGDDGPQAWEALSPAQRSTLRAQLLAEADEERRATGDPSDPRAAGSP